MSRTRSLPSSSLIARAQQICEQREQADHAQMDRRFAGLLIFQWFAAFAIALALSPSDGEGANSAVGTHLVAALVLGAALAVPGCMLACFRPGVPSTRHAMAISQMLFSALLIHISGGRIETHFHVLGSLAFLALYGDWRVLITASVVTAVDHALRGAYWPASVYGVANAQPWRFGEHMLWVAFVDAFLIHSGMRALRQRRSLADRQAELESGQAVLEAEARELTRGLAEARDELLGITRRKSETLANMSHEIRTPLNGIVGTTEVLLGGQLTADQREEIETISACSQHLVAHLNDMLDLSRIEAGTLEFESTQFDPLDLVRELQQQFGPRARSRGLRLELELHPDLPQRLRGDALRVRQALACLLSNAVKFTECGRIVVELAVKELRDGRARLRFGVRDSGIGIGEERRSLLFRAFTQGDSSPTRKYGGTGLGLVIAKRLVEGMGGTIDFESVIGEGSTFWFELDLELGAPPEPSEPGAPLPARSPGATHRRLRVLVAEDNRVNLHVLETMLDRLGHACFVAHDGEAALRVVELEQPDIVLMDCQMPVLDGFGATRELRRRESPDRHTVVIAVTANALLGDREACLSAGMDDYLAKPVDSTTLSQMLERWRERALRASPAAT
ncbi:MAG: response regulator [Planctomycetes bacterium]|nr:response regulator [Planctomycetota bacterium]